MPKKLKTDEAIALAQSKQGIVVSFGYYEIAHPPKDHRMKGVVTSSSAAFMELQAFIRIGKAEYLLGDSVYFPIDFLRIDDSMKSIMMNEKAARSRMNILIGYTRSGMEKLGMKLHPDVEVIRTAKE